MYTEKEDVIMENIIKVVPDKDGKLFITLYGTLYQIVVNKTAIIPEKADN